MLWGSFRLGFGSGRISAPRVIHLGTNLGFEEALEADATARAELHGEARWRVLGIGAQQGAWVCARPKRAYARPTRGRVVLQWVRHGGAAQRAAVEHRQPVFLPLGWPTCQNNGRKR